MRGPGRWFVHMIIIEESDRQMNILSIIEEIGFSGFADITVLTVLIYSILVWFKRTRTAFVVKGMLIMGGAYLLARQLGLELTTSLFQGFFAILLIAIVVFFQEEIKHFLEQIASRSSVKGLKAKAGTNSVQEAVDVIVKAATGLVRQRTGGLIVIEGKDPINRHLDGGIDLDGKVSEQLIRSLFDPHSPGHDGALIIRGERVTAFSCHLPLSKNLGKLQRQGTRHAAALGLAELTDALCIVISEEAGTISVSQNSDMQEASDPSDLGKILLRFYEQITPSTELNPWREFFKKNYREKGIALVVTVFLWFFFVHESRIAYESFLVPIEYESVPPHLIVQESEPSEVEVTFSGPRRSFYFFDRSKLRVSMKLFEARRGKIRMTLTRSNLSFPDGLSLENIQPREVDITIARMMTEGESPAAVGKAGKAE